MDGQNSKPLIAAGLSSKQGRINQECVQKASGASVRKNRDLAWHTVLRITIKLGGNHPEGEPPCALFAHSWPHP
eukprot:1152491-Pelagomonas_calceolata.AAC.3